MTDFHDRRSGDILTPDEVKAIMYARKGGPGAPHGYHGPHPPEAPGAPGPGRGGRYDPVAEEAAELTYIAPGAVTESELLGHPDD